MTRDDRQEQGIEIWKKSNGWGTLEYCTGFGKTITAIKIINKIIKNRGEIIIIIIVPTITLKTQWEEKLKEYSISSFNVYVINTPTLTETLTNSMLECYLVIYDEIHLYLKGEYFSTIFDKIMSKHALGLSGTLSDENKEILNKFLPVIDTITLEEARYNEWVSDYIEYNLFVELNNEEKELYLENEKNLNNSYLFFDYDYNNVRLCMNNLGAINFAKTFTIEGKNVKESATIYKNNAFIYNRCLHIRKNLLFNSISKLKITTELVNKFNIKCITFGESTKAADMLTDMIGNKSLSYHSSIKEKEIEEPVIINGQFSYNIFKELETVKNKYPIKKYKEKIIELLGNNYILCINSAKALNLGVDIPNISLGIQVSGLSGKDTHRQRLGRVVRKDKDKLALFVNIIAKDTQDEIWCKHRQSGGRRAIKVNSVDELYEHYKKLKIC
jgi:superfamily II DNA or RNA helicase